MKTFSNNYKIARDYVKNHASTPINTDVDPAITDQSYDPGLYSKIHQTATKEPIGHRNSSNYYEIPAG